VFYYYFQRVWKYVVRGCLVSYIRELYQNFEIVQSKLPIILRQIFVLVLKVHNIQMLTKLSQVDWLAAAGR
jgi:hypothetical protein